MWGTKLVVWGYRVGLVAHSLELCQIPTKKLDG